MLGWWLVSLFGFDLGLYCGKELGRHHLTRALYHSLTHARDRSTYVNFAGVLDCGQASALFEVEITRSFDESRLTASFNHYSIVRRSPNILQLDRTGKDSLDRPDARFKRRRVRVIRSLFETFTAGYATLQDLGIDQSFKDIRSGRADFVGAFYFHGGAAGCS